MNYIKSVTLCLFLLHCPHLAADVNDYFNKISKDPNLLYTFFKSMPKGGELHYHLSGGPYPETLLKLAARGDFCLNKHSFAAIKMPSQCKGIQSKDLFKYPLFYLDLIKNWSFKDFAPEKESGHNHFFNAFAKFTPIVMDFGPELVANVIQRAAKQKELYLEILVQPDDGNSMHFGSLLKDMNTMNRKRNALLANADFQKNIHQAVTKTERMIKEAYALLKCDSNPKPAVCNTQIKLLYYVLREQSLNKVFAQALTAFESVKRSKGELVGVNLVQAEDGPISLRDYRKQMAIFHYLHQLYPQVKITLHAGELAQDLVDPTELTYHIHDALFTGHAQRIGHGVDILHENNSPTLVNYMAKNQIPVEINLISNLKILNIAGSKHPLRYYLDHKVPVVLSTDDEGILRTDLTQQYVTAVLANGLTYAELKQINRNALTYAFLPGKSLWSHADKAERIRVCQDLNSKGCKAFIKTSQKAKLQWKLEQKLKAFEERY